MRAARLHRYGVRSLLHMYIGSDKSPPGIALPAMSKLESSEANRCQAERLGMGRPAIEATLNNQPFMITSGP